MKLEIKWFNKWGEEISLSSDEFPVECLVTEKMSKEEAKKKYPELFNK